MKRFSLILLTAMLLFLPLASVAKNPSVKDLYKEFSSAPKAETVSVSPLLMKLAHMCIGNDSDAKIVRKIKSVKLLDLEECSREVRKRFADRAGSVQIKDMDELVSVSDDGDKLKVFAKIKSEKITKMLVLCYGKEDCCLIEINGKFDMGDIEGVVKSQKPRKNGR